MSTTELDPGVAEEAGVNGETNVDDPNALKEAQDRDHVLALATDVIETRIAGKHEEVREHADALIDAGISGKTDKQSDQHWEKGQKAAEEAQFLGRQADLAAYQAGRYYDGAKSITDKAQRNPLYAELEEDKNRANIMAIASSENEQGTARFQERAADHAAALIDKGIAGERDKEGDWEKGLSAADVAKSKGDAADAQANEAGRLYDAAQAMIAQSKDRNPR